jgi:hypothetical protein
MKVRSVTVALGLLMASSWLWSSAALCDGVAPASADAAHVKLWSIENTKTTVYLDSAAVAILPNAHAFVALDLVPGWHLLWGAGDPEWFLFEAGHTYALALAMPSRGNWKWCLDDPFHAQLYFNQKKLAALAPDPTALSALTAKVSNEKLEKLRKQAGEPIEPRLPAEFKALYRKSASALAGMFKVETDKKIRVDADSITIAGGATIPIAAIEGLQCYGSDASVPWVAVLSHGDKSVEVAMFGTFDQYNQLFSSIALARAGAKAKGDSTAATH